MPPNFKYGNNTNGIVQTSGKKAGARINVFAVASTQNGPIMGSIG
jgi:hypothetical protein